ncbi:hypothetical protein NEPAR04_2304 [Nematocida parisii]|nr:hypothetical protein NEPAR03_2252 [Nematocida parisii]KAI5130962.1 hypothetical protein NEPAR08_2278 [Nematocida parisii]KAI5144990.1 hypothetical protein NEPAR04_2304 [Nematocida parisii]
MKYPVCTSLLYPPPLIESLHAVDKSINKTYKHDKSVTAYDYIRSGCRMAKFLLADTIVSLSANCISKSLGASAVFNALTTNGPLIMKLGQFLSTRTEVFSDESIIKLRSIQDSAPEVKLQNHPLDILYKEVGIRLPDTALKQRIGAGCISQVYKVRMGNKDYALKIIDESTAVRVSTDIHVLEFISWVCGATRFYREFKQNMHAQMDLRKEKMNTDQFRRNFSYYQSTVENSSVINQALSYFMNRPSFIFPKPILATKRILLTEYWPGTKIPPWDKNTSKSLLIMFMKMIFKDRFIHSDLHPGNLSVYTGARTGQTSSSRMHTPIIVYDAGLTHSLTLTQRNNLSDLIKNICLGHKRSALSLIIDRNMLNKHTPQEKDTFIKSAISYWGMCNKKWSTFDRALKIYFLARQHKVFLDSSYTNIIMSSIYMQNHLKGINQFDWRMAVMSGCTVDYLDLLRQWKKFA